MKMIRLSEGTIDSAVQEAVKVLRKGGIILYPTDTLYGLAVDALNPAAIASLKELKGREKKKPISIVVEKASAIDDYAELHAVARPFAERFLPGALTLVLPGRQHMPQELLLNGTVGVRVPDDKFTLALARAFGKPFTATSANRSGLITPTTVEAIVEQFGSRIVDIELVIDDGERNAKQPSTVVAFQDGVPRILREGALLRVDLGL